MNLTCRWCILAWTKSLRAFDSCCRHSPCPLLWLRFHKSVRIILQEEWKWKRIIFCFKCDIIDSTVRSVCYGAPGTLSNTISLRVVKIYCKSMTLGMSVFPLSIMLVCEVVKSPTTFITYLWRSMLNLGYWCSISWSMVPTISHLYSACSSRESTYTGTKSRDVVLYTQRVDSE